jgi:hypothetical protein
MTFVKPVGKFIDIFAHGADFGVHGLIYLKHLRHETRIIVSGAALNFVLEQFFK